MANEDTKWHESNNKLHAWLEERHELMIEFTELCALKPFTNRTQTQECLLLFCQTLVDYVSALHFEIFEIIAQAAEHDHNGDKLTKELVVSLLKTTNYALAFNDKYNQGISSNTDMHDFEKDLNLLGEQFAIRLDCEEELIQIYNHATHFLDEIAAN